MIENPAKLTDEVVKTNYEQIIKNVLPFLQVLPQMFQRTNIAETFKFKKSHRYNN